MVTTMTLFVCTGKGSPVRCAYFRPGVVCKDCFRPCSARRALFAENNTETVYSLGGWQIGRKRYEHVHVQLDWQMDGRMGGQMQPSIRPAHCSGAPPFPRDGVEHTHRCPLGGRSLFQIYADVCNPGDSYTYFLKARLLLTWMARLRTASTK